jgi:hypothetical protein
MVGQLSKHNQQPVSKVSVRKGRQDGLGIRPSFSSWALSSKKHHYPLSPCQFQAVPFLETVEALVAELAELERLEHGH